MNRGIRVVAAVMVYGLVLLVATEARADRKWEVGGAVGLHTFSLNSELGVWDVPWATSPADSLFLGLHASDIQPFALVGIGGIGGIGNIGGISSDPTAIGNDADFVWHVGGGVKYRISPRCGLRQNARVLFPASNENRLATTDTEAFPGVSFAFPGQPQAPVKVPVDSDISR